MSRNTSPLFQPSLMDELPEGVSLFRGMALPEMQARLVELTRELCRVAPLITPQTKFGTDFNLRITSWGEWGWLSDKNGYRYSRLHPATSRPWPKIPSEIMMIMQRAAGDVGYPNFNLQTVLANFYNQKSGSLGRHCDRAEKALNAPIVTISLGDSCVFGLGGINYSDPVQEIMLDSGDVLVMGGVARLFYHEVLRILPRTSNLLKSGGRISLTGRTYI